MTELRVISDGIFKKLYRVSIPMFQLKTAAQIKARPRIGSGIESIDRSVNREISRPYMCVEKIATHYNQGHNISMINHKDRIPVYDCICEYIDGWMDLSEESHNIKIDIEHLESLDNLAKSIYTLMGGHIIDHESRGHDYDNQFVIAGSGPEVVFGPPADEEDSDRVPDRRDFLPTKRNPIARRRRS